MFITALVPIIVAVHDNRENKTALENYKNTKPDLHPIQIASRSIAIGSSIICIASMLISNLF